MYFPKPAVNENDLAIIERGDTASHSISAGQYISWKGKLGKATSAILQGATLDDSLFSYETDGVINSLNNNFNNFIRKSSVAAGVIQLNSLTSTSGSMYYKDFTYGKTFSSVPKLIMSTVNNTWPNYGDIGGNYFAANVTKTGFRLYCKYNIANYYIHWIAIDS